MCYLDIIDICAIYLHIVYIYINVFNLFVYFFIYISPSPSDQGPPSLTKYVKIYILYIYTQLMRFSLPCVPVVITAQGGDGSFNYRKPKQR